MNGRKKLPRGVSPLPPGVSPEIFAPPPQPAPPGGARRSSNLNQPSTLPPPVTAEPWPMKPRARRGVDGPGATPTVVITEPEPAEGGGRLRRLLLLMGGTFLILMLAYAIPAAYMWGKVPPGTHVGDVRIGGLSETEALDLVHRRFDGNDQNAIGLLLRGRQVGVLDPRDAGLTIDVQATVADAQAGFPSPLAVWQAFTGGRDLPLRISLNEQKLGEQVRRIAKEVDQPASEGAIVYKGTMPVVVPPKEGVVLNQRATGEAIKRAFVNAPASVDLPVSPVRPKAGKTAFDSAMDVARKAVSAPIILVNGSRQARLPARTVAANLTFVTDDRGGVVPKFDARKAVDGIETRLVGVSEAPREAAYVIAGSVPKLVHARVGKGVDTDRLAAEVAKVVAGGGSRTIPVSLATIEPALDDKGAVKLGISEQVGSFTTSFPCCGARVTNIRKAAELVDGRLVKPGETFSLNDVLGRPDPDRGFVAAQAIQGDRVVITMGGGVSQLATTMYNAVFLAGLEDVDHTPHPFYISRYPAGLDAAVSYPAPDLRWRNDTEYGVLVKASSTDTSVTVTLWSTKKYDRIEAETSQRSNVTQPETKYDNDPSCIPMQGGPGFTITVTRVFHKDGKVFKRDRPQTTVYRPQPKIVCEQGRVAPTETAAAASEPAAKNVIKVSDSPSWRMETDASVTPG